MLTNGRTDGRTNRRKLARLSRPAKAGATKITIDTEHFGVSINSHPGAFPSIDATFLVTNCNRLSYEIHTGNRRRIGYNTGAQATVFMHLQLILTELGRCNIFIYVKQSTIVISTSLISYLEVKIRSLF